MSSKNIFNPLLGSLTQVITGRKVFAAIRSIGNVTSDSVNNGTVPLFDTDVSLHGSPDTLITYGKLMDVSS